MRGRSNASFWLEGISILVGGFSLFSLANTAFEFGLSDFVARFTSLCRSVFHPIIGVAEPVLRTISTRLGFDLPAYWRDFTVFYLVIGGAVVRVHARDERLAFPVRLLFASLRGIAWIVPLLVLPFMLAASKKSRAAARTTIAHYKDVIAQIIYAGAALLIFLAVNAYGS